MKLTDLKKTLGGNSIFAKARSATAGDTPAAASTAAAGQSAKSAAPQAAAKQEATSSNKKDSSSSSNRKRAPTLSPPASRPRVSFRDEDDLASLHDFHAVEGSDEYDRQPIHNANWSDEQRKLINKELLEFHEKEMRVHPKAKDTKTHEWLEGNTYAQKYAVRKKLKEIDLTSNPSKRRSQMMRF